MRGSAGGRPRWEDLPPHVRAGVEDVLGSPVVRADSQAGGFSPGSADRVLTAAGRRAFVKAVGAAQNPHSPVLHRREARVSAALPPSLPVPRLLGVFDAGARVALVLEEVDGHQPPLPWRAGDVDAVLGALAALDGDTPVHLDLRGCGGGPGPPSPAEGRKGTPPATAPGAPARGGGLPPRVPSSGRADHPRPQRLALVAGEEA